MKRVGLCLLLLIVVPVMGQESRKVVLSPKSNIATAEVARGFAKYCPNVMVTENEAKADYVLEAAESMSADKGTTYSQWHFTLMNRDGDVLVTTKPEMHWGSRTKHHFESVCRYINK